MLNEYPITLNTCGISIGQTIHMVAGDTGRRIRARISDMDVDSETEASFHATLQDGTRFTNNATFDNGCFIVDPTEVIQNGGKLECQLDVSGVRTRSFFIDVENALSDSLNSREITGDSSALDFESESVYPLESLVVEMDPIQDLHGYEKPWPAGGGKNKLDPSTITLSKMTFADGIYSASDGDTRDQLILKLQHYNGNSLIRTDTIGTVTEPGEYVVMGPIPEGTTRLRFSNNGTTSEFSMIFPLPSSVPEFSIVTFYIEVVDATVGASKYKNPMLVFGDLSGGYEPYSNVCPISGTDSVTVARTGVNVWDEETEDGYISDAGQLAPVPTSYPSLRSKNFCLCKPSTKYYYVKPSSYTVKPNFAWYDIDKNFIRRSNPISEFPIAESPSNAYYFKLSMYNYGTVYNHDISINFPSTDHSYHAYQGDTIMTDLGRTVYGGTLDIVSGVLTVTHAADFISSWTSYWNSTEGKVLTVYASLTNTPKEIDDLTPAIGCYGISNQFEWFPYDKAYDGKPSIYSIRANSSYPSAFSLVNTSRVPKKIIMKDSSCASIADYNSKYGASNPVQVIYELATPQTYQLTPAQIVTLLGKNYIWTDSGKIIKVKTFGARS